MAEQLAAFGGSGMEALHTLAHWRNMGGGRGVRDRAESP